MRSPAALPNDMFCAAYHVGKDGTNQLVGLISAVGADKDAIDGVCEGQWCMNTIPYVPQITLC
jgi:hypothetical protein